MVRMPIKTFAVSAALALAMVLITVPLGDIVQASTPMHGWMMHDDGGSAWFKPNELPDPFERDFGDSCKWWRYDLKNGNYVRTYSPCRYGDQDADYSTNVRGMWQASLNRGAVVITVAAREPVDATEVQNTEVVAVPVEESTAVSEEMTASEDMAASEDTVAPEDMAASEEAETPPPGTVTLPARPPAGTVKMPAEPPAGTVKMPPKPMPGGAVHSLVDTLAERTDNAALLAAAGAAGLTETLRSGGPYTIFAPSVSAFMALPPGLLDQLLDDPSGELAEIVKYHVVSGMVNSADMADGDTLQTLQGSVITITVDGDSILIGEARLVEPDIMASNGVIHVIDAVLEPPEQ